MTVRSSYRRLPSPRRRRLSALGLLLAVVVAAAAGPVAAQSDEEIIKDSKQIAQDREAKREELDRAAEAASESLDAATAEADDLIDALNKAQDAVFAQQNAREEAERAVADAEAVVQQAEAKIAELEEELLATQEGLREAVIESYVSFQAPTGALSVLGADPWENSREEALAGFATGGRIDDIDDLRRLGEELERWRLQAAAAAAEAQSHRRATTVILADLEAAAEREAELTVAAEERVERRLYEVQTIKQIDAEYAAEIEAAERRIAEALARKRAEEEALRRAEVRAQQEADERARLQALESEALAESQALAESVNPDDENFTLVWVRGFQVNAEIADETDGLVAAMEAEGFDLGGWGYRDHQAQINLRQSHCGTSDWAVWQMPSHQCRPPTARPGRSNHEKGLAIDFTNAGRLITSRSSAVFQALQRIAPRFGFLNLPSEPWHWSVDGR